MDKIKLDIREQNILIKEIQAFVLTEFNAELSEAEAFKLLDFILSKVEYGVYNQIASETCYNIQQQLKRLLGIKTPPLN
ncbi:MAG: DUF2164 family protein [Veillonellales bacterium]